MKKTLFLVAAAAMAVSTASATDFILTGNVEGGTDPYVLAGDKTGSDHLVLGGKTSGDYTEVDFTINTTENTSTTVWNINDEDSTNRPVNSVTFNFGSSSTLNMSTSRTSRYKTGTFAMNFAEGSTVTMGGLKLEGEADNGNTTATIAMSNNSKLTLNQALTAAKTSLTLSGTTSSNLELKNGGNLNKLTFDSGNLTISGGTATFGFDMSRSKNASTGAIAITGNGKLSTNADAWIGVNSGGISISGNGEFFRGTNGNAISVKALNGQTATVKVNSGGANYASSSEAFTVSNAEVTMTNNTLKNKLVNSDLIGENANLKVSLQSGYSINKVTANQNMKFFFAGDDGMTVQALTLNSGSDVSVFKAGTEQGTPQANLTTTMLTVNAAGSALNGGLVVSGAGASISIADNAALTLGGAVSIGDGVTIVLTEEMVNTIADGGRVDLFTGVTGLTLGNNIAFTGATVSPELAGVYKVNFDNGTVYVTPEPATATLSLLALAGLASRRKRK